MKRIILIFFLVSGCINNQNENINTISNIQFSDKLSFDEFKKKLEIYANNSPYPDIDN